LINSLKIEKINSLDNGESVNIKQNNELYMLSPDDVEIYFQDIEGWLVASEAGKTIALDTTINEFLKNEGISREIVNRIQNLRKESDFKVSDKIIIEIESNNLIEKAIFENIDYVKNETLAKELNFLDNLDVSTKIEFDNFSLNVKIYKIN
jgi:isoleucyl-tRNA synthetase